MGIVAGKSMGIVAVYILRQHIVTPFIVPASHEAFLTYHRSCHTSMPPLRCTSSAYCYVLPRMPRRVCEHMVDTGSIHTVELRVPKAFPTVPPAL